MYPVPYEDEGRPGVIEGQRGLGFKCGDLHALRKSLEVFYEDIGERASSDIVLVLIIEMCQIAVRGFVRCQRRGLEKARR